ncbi:hypothetical protein SPRG_20648 [Saprolegnia parasitica CBS 223.65]|uniref:Uncharacterized protein n=1 Tax=Saprolegnia parasitica (strain CBS 223.65) TaxID=695850 RepID=A0A067CFC8_SAPPC|nr:hypothetical protein SPRG_20648 [Saprolegnia parasitica CBS 223.65]KDO25527.1 hypothetical protein SPRG_20648 [Saprolegnia parasitica CBS 223.65]|eukprot:XP_012203757.1 hypothetical protein SPRG_20648 [Saprolegnia parasitica CBS 223.65]
MSREERKTAQIWASIEKMQKKEEDSMNHSDNSSSDRQAKRKKGRKKDRKRDSLDDDAALTMHKSDCQSWRTNPFVPPTKKWRSRWEHNHPRPTPTIDTMASPKQDAETMAPPQIDTAMDSKPTPSVPCVAPAEASTPLPLPSIGHHRSQEPDPEDDEEGLVKEDDIEPAPVQAAPERSVMMITANVHVVEQPVDDKAVDEPMVDTASTEGLPSVVPPTSLHVDEPEPTTLPVASPSVSKSSRSPSVDDSVRSPSTSAERPRAPSEMNAIGSRRKRKSLWDVGDPRLGHERATDLVPSWQNFASTSSSSSSSSFHAPSSGSASSRRYQPYIQPRGRSWNNSSATPPPSSSSTTPSSSYTR